MELEAAHLARTSASGHLSGATLNAMGIGSGVGPRGVREIELRIPKLRTGSYRPSFLKPRRRAEQALVAAVQEAYVNGVSTRKVDRLVEQMGLRGLSRIRYQDVPRAG